MTAKRKIKECLARSMRRLKHRKGHGVHSPFAYAIITEVIEEKTHYYKYPMMRPLYAANRKVFPYKVATLLFRLANRFRVRQILEVGCDAGLTLMPLTLVDSSNQLWSLSTQPAEQQLTAQRLGAERMQQVSFVSDLHTLPSGQLFDMVVINRIPDNMNEEELCRWVSAHVHEKSIIFVHGLRRQSTIDACWTRFCNDQNISVTMDLYHYGLAIYKPRFFKQHYIVSF